MRKIPKAVLDRAVAAYDEKPDADPRERLRRALRATGAAFPGDDFMGAAESAEEFGVKTPNLHRIDEVPEPFGRVRSGPFWLADTIRDVARERERLRNNNSG